MTMPGPVNPQRLLYRELDLGAFSGVSGAVRVLKYSLGKLLGYAGLIGHVVLN